MHNPQSIVMLLLESILTGFGIVIPILALIRTSNLKTIGVKDLFILTALQMVRLAGIAYFILWLVNSWESLEYALFGLDWISLTLGPIMTLILTQLFWIKKLYMKKVSLIATGLLLIVFNRMFLILFIEPLFRDYKSIGWAVDHKTFILQAALNVIVFIFITFAVMLSGGKLKKIFSTPN